MNQPLARLGYHLDVDVPLLDFLLLPDRGAARRARRLVASRGARLGVVAGTWTELQALALEARVCPPPLPGWESALGEALAGIDDAFWSRSFDAAPRETAHAVGDALTAVLAAGPPGARGIGVDGSRVRGRAGARLADLARLTEALDGRLPPSLESAASVLEAPHDRALRRLRVLNAEGAPALDRWQKAVLGRLGADGEDVVTGADPALCDALEQAVAGGPGAPAGTALGTLQAALFDADVSPAAPDDSVQFLGVRDWLAEAEVAAGIAQRLLDARAVGSAAEIGLLLPDDAAYAAAVADAFGHAGLPVAGLPADVARRDLGREFVHALLACLRGPPPATALAGLLVSPLAPWSAAQGSELAQRVMRGEHALRLADRGQAGGVDQGGALLDLLREGAADAAGLDAALARVPALLDPALVDDGSASGSHAMRALEALARVRAALAPTLRVGGPADWAAFHAAVGPEEVLGEPVAQYTAQGITVIPESQSPWRPVRHLLVLGFSAGRYPARPPASPVFGTADLEALARDAGLVLDGPGQIMARRRRLLLRQLRAAAEGATFLVPRRDGLGKPVPASDTLIYAARAFGGRDPVLDVERAEERTRARHLALAPPSAPVPPRALRAADPELGRDLLALRVDARGRARPESPSSLDRLMVSPLAWLLRKLRAEPRPWAPETLDAALLGTLAHAVFETLFCPGAPLPARGALPERVRGAVVEAARAHAPFLATGRWRIERRHLETELERAALAWHAALETLGAEVIASEVALAGTLAGPLGGLPVHGHADAILAVSGDRLLVVDYKKARSASRRERMEAGYDSQVSLYRAMLETGGPEASGDTALASRLAAAGEIGVLYVMLNDGGLLADRAVPGASELPGWVVVDADVSEHAMALIAERLEALRAGRIELNRVGDEEWLSGTARVRPYAFDDSPLVRLFLAPASGEGE